MSGQGPWPHRSDKNVAAHHNAAAGEDVPNVVVRAAKVIARRGIRGTLTLMASTIIKKAYLREHHVWYWLNIEHSPPLALPAGAELVEGDVSSLTLLAPHETVSRREAGRRLARGNKLWLIRDAEDRVIFACWTMEERLPAIAGRGGWVTLPAATAAIEDPLTVTEWRGRGLATAAFLAIAARLRERGLRSLTAKVEEDNRSCRRALERAGFQEVADMRLERIGGRSHVAVDARDVVASFLVAQLPR
jgi:RimJ/RimL family protein N-acetyltransferase